MPGGGRTGSRRRGPRPRLIALLDGVAARWTPRRRPCLTRRSRRPSSTTVSSTASTSRSAFIRRGRTVQPRPGANRAIPVLRQQDPKSLAPGQPRLTAETVESPVRGNAHAGFGERPAETGRWQHRHRAAGRLNHPGAQLRFTDLDGLRLTCFATNTKGGQLADLELRHRRQARCEDRIRNARDTGLRNLPLHDTAQNQIWLEIVSLALDLLAWMPMLALTTETRRWEPKKLRLRLFSAAAQLVTTGRRRWLRFTTRWPWTNEVIQAIRLNALPSPG
ncbi:transposase [Streptomyces sp. NPDC057543]|uniref:transposase n=1 Tax=Streptomyces sp. NPDC057543 TaxID=3346163 RepID=UPI0036A248C7